MELNNINSTVNNLSQNDTNQLKKLQNTNDLSSDTNNSAVNVSFDMANISQKSDLSNHIKSMMDNVSSSSVLTSMIKDQIQVVANISTATSNLQNKNLTQNEVQPQIAEFISRFNTSTQNVNHNMNTLEDLDGDSTTYFDGKAGAIPLDVDLLNTEAGIKSIELNSTLNKVQELNNSYKVSIKSMIDQETQVVNNESPFKNMDFGKESADFSSTNITNISGSIVSTQANAAQAQIIRLLA